MHEHLKGKSKTFQELNSLTKEIADQVKKELKDLGKDKRYKFLV